MKYYITYHIWEKYSAYLSKCFWKERTFFSDGYFISSIGNVSKEILKNCNLFNKSPKLVSCPTCGRIQYDLIPIAKEIEKFLQGIEADITVAIMGCGVNGPGEAREADIGIAGGVGEGLLFKKGEIVRKIKEENMIEELKQEILEMIKDK